jgi:hypothetical protein
MPFVAVLISIVISLKLLQMSGNSEVSKSAGFGELKKR